MSWVIAHAISAVKSETPQFQPLGNSLSPSSTAVSRRAFPRSMQKPQTGLTSPTCRTPPGQKADTRQTHPGLTYYTPVLMSPY